MNKRRREALTGITYAIIPMAGFLLFYIIPFLISLYMSFRSGMGGTQFAGLNNYISILTSPTFQMAAGNTARFMAIGVPLLTALSLLAAVLLFGIGKPRKRLQTILMLPMVIPSASIILFFRVMFDRGGAVNGLLQSFNLNPVDFLTSGNVFYVLVLLYIWKNMGWNIIIFMAGLSQIPQDCYEAADMDGASAWRKLLSITLPQLKGAFFFVAVMAIIQSFRSFREAFVLAGAYPDDSIYMLQHFMNNNFFNLNYQRLSPAAVLLLLFIIPLIGGLMLYARKGGDTA
jgi:multiple sugar transport system permease protein